MKLKFQSNLQYQNDAISSIVDIFKGQKMRQSNFTVLNNTTEQLSFGSVQTNTGIGNSLDLTYDDILENVQNIQIRNNLKRSEKLEGMNFTVEMETGTGKTYVYLKTIYELNQKYGFTKFIIVVPSIAIREGVNKTLQITEEHFKGIFNNEPANYFVYDSSKLDQVRSFATSNTIEIMIINIDAFRKSFDDPEKEDKSNIIHRAQDKLNGQKPIDLIKETNPIVIIDEPQSVDTTDKSKDAIKSLNPLCTLRSSATHVDEYNMMYRLDAVDAYEHKLVKRIEVLSIRSEDSFNIPYVKLIKVEERKATIEIDVQDKSGAIKRTKKKIKMGDDLKEISNGRDFYSNYIVQDISWGLHNEYVEFSNGRKIYLNGAIGDLNDDEVKRFQIRKTIEEHLDKEMQLNPKGIKVLSLFFIDKVANYREYDKDNNPIKGKYAKMFEEEYAKLICLNKYKENENLNLDVSFTHNGYFAQDKKKGKIVYKDTKGNTKLDDDAYNLIMKDKERLLSMDNPLRFIFSHSALREGWDNPNVFQICTLKESKGTYISRRQEIGRGLRLCVNQEGERVEDYGVNRLTVMANESYAEFVSGLQTEIERDTNIKFGIVEKHSFANVKRADNKNFGENIYMGYDKSENLFKYLVKEEYITDKGSITDKLKVALDPTNDEEKLKLDEEFVDFYIGIYEELNKRVKTYEIKDASKKKKVELNKAVLESEEFINLWNRINEKTIYRLDFDTDELIRKCIEDIMIMPKVSAPRVYLTKDIIDTIDRRSGIEGRTIREDQDNLEYKIELPDIITDLQNKTNLTRKTIIKILVDSKRLDDFKRNPQKYIEEVTKIIRSNLRIMAVDGITYHKFRGGEYYSIDNFDNSELITYLNDKVVESKKSPYNYAICDSDVEMRFAKKFEEREDVKVYVKLPNWFKIETPIGSYNPDWAVVISQNDEDRLYFVVETKGNSNIDMLRAEEKAKIKCARKHFEALETDVEFRGPESSPDDFMSKISVLKVKM